MRRITLVLSLLVMIALVWFNYASLAEAFGSGPPYYSRSTNMDKWVSPLPVLIPLDAIALLGVGFVLSRRFKH
jgi:hypothetical protein